MNSDSVFSTEQLNVDLLWFYLNCIYFYTSPAVSVNVILFFSPSSLQECSYYSQYGYLEL